MICRLGQRSKQIVQLWGALGEQLIGISVIASWISCFIAPGSMCSCCYQFPVIELIKLACDDSFVWTMASGGEDAAGRPAYACDERKDSASLLGRIHYLDRLLGLIVW